LTFARAVEKVSDGDSGRSNVASIDRKKIPAERLLPKDASWCCRPVAVRRRLKLATSKLPLIINDQGSCPSAWCKSTAQKN